MTQHDTHQLAIRLKARLSSLYAVCKEVAEKRGAHYSEDSHRQELFCQQMSTGLQDDLPRIRLVGDRVTVEVVPVEICSNHEGKTHASLDVRRTLTAGGRINSASCWTDLDSSNDEHWYSGNISAKDSPLDASTVGRWLDHSGPPPLV